MFATQVASLTKALLEAAFDGEDKALIQLLSQAKDIIKDVVSSLCRSGNHFDGRRLAACSL